MALEKQHGRLYIESLNVVPEANKVSQGHLI